MTSFVNKEFGLKRSVIADDHTTHWQASSLEMHLSLNLANVWTKLENADGSQPRWQHYSK